MDVNQFNQRFINDSAVRTQLATTLAERLHANDISSKDVTFQVLGDDQLNIDSILVGSESEDLQLQLRVADAAIKALKEQGVTDLSGIKPLLPTSDPKTLNVVYKDGGWVVNTKEIQNL